MDNPTVATITIGYWTIGGADADGASTIINHQGAVPDSGPGYDPTPASAQPFGNFGIKWEKEGEAMFTPNEDGKQSPFPLQIHSLLTTKKATI